MNISFVMLPLPIAALLKTLVLSLTQNYTSTIVLYSLYYLQNLSLDCFYMIYHMLLRSKSEYASAVWNSITPTDANKLDSI
jgi:hypothetical protein